METEAHIQRRREPRFEAALYVRFTINGGPEHVSNTLNFTSKSLAIRSDCVARKGDLVEVRFGALPPISGKVARVFPEGFAVILNEESLSDLTPVKPSRQNNPLNISVRAPENTGIVSPFIRGRAHKPVRVRIHSYIDPVRTGDQHFLTISAQPSALLKDIESVWLKCADTRWTTETYEHERRDGHVISVISLNDWQLHMAAAYGLTVSMVNAAFKDWSFAVDAPPIAKHLQRLPAPLQAANG